MSQIKRKVGASNEAPSEPQGADSDVGVLLRAARLRRGEDLRDTALMLRVRYFYLQAIEEGRFQDLPGPTYATGFVRSYADHLGLDGDEMVRRFKAETSNFGGKAPLLFPEPVNERGLPGGVLLLIAALLAAGAYGGWYYVTSRNKAMSDLVPPLPERLAVLLSDRQASAPVPEAKLPSETRGAPSAAAPAASGPASPASQPAAGKSEGTAAPSSSAATATPSPTPPSPAPAGEEARKTTVDASKPVTKQDRKPEAAPAAATPASDQASSAPAAPTAPSVSEKKPETPPAGSQATGPQTTGSQAAASPTADLQATGSQTAPPAKPVEAAAIPEPPSDSEPAREGRVYGETNGTARVILKAKADNWIEVRDAEDKPLLKRLLKAGDSYRVPNTPGLTLLAGNAGALEVIVDGKAAPSLGAMGSVRRNVALDPEKLLTGTTVQ